MHALSEAKFVVLDVETTGLSPAMGDRVVELGMVVCQGETEISRTSYLINPKRLIPIEAQRIHGISDEDVSGGLTFKEIAEEIKSILVDSWIIGHNIRFDASFMAMELQQANCSASPLGCLDTCQLASALWDFPNYKLETVVNSLDIPATRFHRALDDAVVTREIFNLVVRVLGGWKALTVDDLLRLHRYKPLWPSDPKCNLPKPLYDALANGRTLAIRYVNADGQSPSRMIRPETSFASGRFTYIRAYCEKSAEIRTFRLDRIIVE